jgi:hypothetical protein
MPVTITPYNHTAARHRSGANAVGDSYKINLYTVLPANLTSTTKAAAESGATQVATANGYTQNAKTLTGVTVATVTTNDAKFDADDVSWTPSGGNIVGLFAMIFNDTDTDDPPLYRIDFGGTITAIPGDTFQINWHPDGIDTTVVA